MSYVLFVEEDLLDNRAVRVIEKYKDIRIPQQGETVFMPASEGFVWTYQVATISQFPRDDVVIIRMEKTRSEPIPALNFGGTPPESGGVVPEDLPPGGPR